jgi:hypothetical protein
LATSGARSRARTTRRIGRFEQAHGGTLFLDEIGDMSPLTQAKLLRVLQEKTIQRVGGKEDIPVDVRIISATHRDLEGAIAAQQFREDLYYRLAGMVIDLPPLRERGNADIERLVRYFLARFGKELGQDSPGDRAGGDSFAANPSVARQRARVEQRGPARTSARGWISHRRGTRADGMEPSGALGLRRARRVFTRTSKTCCKRRSAVSARTFMRKSWKRRSEFSFRVLSIWRAATRRRQHAGWAWRGKPCGRNSRVLAASQAIRPAIDVEPDILQPRSSAHDVDDVGFLVRRAGGSDCGKQRQRATERGVAQYF